MYVKRIICLANSRKISGRCVAGIEIDNGALKSWIRPVSNRDSQEISEEERRYEDGSDPRVLDVIDIPLQEPKPHRHQTENHVINKAYYWIKAGTASWEDLQAAVDTSADTLWANGDSSYNGRNDRMSQDLASRFKTSLMLIKPDSLTVLVRTEGVEFGNPRRRVRTEFAWKGVRYLLSLTDPVAERKYLQMDDGEYRVNDAILCVSVGEPWDDGKCYKFCATLITQRSSRS
jgi:hypothetical protein